AQAPTARLSTRQKAHMASRVRVRLRSILSLLSGGQPTLRCERVCLLIQLVYPDGGITRQPRSRVGAFFRAKRRQHDYLCVAPPPNGRNRLQHLRADLARDRDPADPRADPNEPHAPVRVGHFDLAKGYGAACGRFDGELTLPSNNGELADRLVLSKHDLLALTLYRVMREKGADACVAVLIPAGALHRCSDESRQARILPSRRERPTGHLDAWPQRRRDGRFSSRRQTAVQPDPERQNAADGAGHNAVYAAYARRKHAATRGTLASLQEPVEEQNRKQHAESEHSPAQHAVLHREQVVLHLGDVADDHEDQHAQPVSEHGEHERDASEHWRT